MKNLQIIKFALAGFLYASTSFGVAGATSASQTLTLKGVTEETRVITPAALAELKKDVDAVSIIQPRLIWEPGVDSADFNPQLKAEKDRVLKLGETNFPVKDMALVDAIRLICEVSGVKFIAPQRKGVFDTKLTLKARVNPWLLMDSLADSYGFSYGMKDGILRFYEVNFAELVPKSYKLKYTDLAVAELTPGSLNNQLSRGGSGGGQSQGNRSRQDGQANIQSSAKSLIDGITEILARPTTGLKIPDLNRPPEFNQYGEPVFTKGTVKYVPDAFCLEVFATRQQHEYIKQWLASVDVAQRLVQIETQFVEIASGDDQTLGLDASGLGSTEIKATGLSSGAINFDKLSSTPWPANAVIQVSDLAITLNALKSNNQATILQNPTAITLNNRKVSLGSTRQVPIQSADNNLTTGAGSSNTATIDYVEIGTKMTVLPLIVESHPDYGNLPAVRLDVTLTISSQTGTQRIGENDYPVVSSRAYAYTVVVPDQHSLAIAGLRETRNKEIKKYTPILGWIPGIREIPYLGNSTETSVYDSNLLAFITPRILGQKDFDANSRSLQMPTKDRALRATGAEVGLLGSTYHEDRQKVLLPSQGAAVSDSPALSVQPPAPGEVDVVRFRGTPVAVSDASSAESLSSQSIGAMTAGDYATARRRLEEILAADPSNDEARSLLKEVKAAELAY